MSTSIDRKGVLVVAEIISPSWIDFDEVVTAASAELLICTPFYSADGLAHIERNLGNAPVVRFRVRLSPSDWATGISDPNALLNVVGTLQRRNCTVEIGVNQRLHAKAYAADDSLLLLGSSNLTSGGFGNNIELMVRMRGEEVMAAREPLTICLLPNLRTISYDELAQWVATALPVIAKVGEMQDDEASELLIPVQQRLDILLGYGKGRKPAADPTEDDLDAFVTWLREHTDLPGAEMLIARKDNLQRLSGKFNQSFYGVYRFLSESPQYTNRLSTELDKMQGDDIFAFDDSEITDAWANHLDEHALDRTPFFSYPTLRGYLTPRLGGTLTGGGGGGSTLKRMMPVVARYLRSRDATSS